MKYPKICNIGNYNIYLFIIIYKGWMEFEFIGLDDGGIISIGFQSCFQYDC